MPALGVVVIRINEFFQHDDVFRAEGVEMEIILATGLVDEVTDQGQTADVSTVRIEIDSVLASSCDTLSRRLHQLDKMEPEVVLADAENGTGKCGERA